jgi:hypothetical protein
MSKTAITSLRPILFAPILAGMAVLGMTATLAGAQTGEVKPAPSAATQISEIPDKFVMPDTKITTRMARAH